LRRFAAISADSHFAQAATRRHYGFPFFDIDFQLLAFHYYLFCHIAAELPVTTVSIFELRCRHIFIAISPFFAFSSLPPPFHFGWLPPPDFSLPDIFFDFQLDFH